MTTSRVRISVIFRNGALALMLSDCQPVRIGDGMIIIHIHDGGMKYAVPVDAVQYVRQEPMPAEPA